MPTNHQTQTVHRPTPKMLFKKLLLALILIIFVPTLSRTDSTEYDHALNSYNTKDYETAFSIWKRLANDDHADAQYALGVAYFKGEGVSRDLSKAMNWFELAANSGNAEAMFNLGAAHWEGNGTRQSYADAVEWWKKSALMDQSAAQYNLGLAYYLGKGVEQDLNQALIWISKSASNGHSGAHKILSVLQKELPQTTPSAEIKNPGREVINKDAQADQSTENVSIISVNYQSAVVSGLGSQGYPSQDANGTVLANLAGGTPIKILGLKGNWAKVNVPGVANVWVYTKYVHTKDGGGSFIKGARVRARSLPSTGANSIPVGIFEDGEEVIAFSERDSWTQVIAPARMPLWMPIQNLQPFPTVTNAWLALWEQALSNITDKTSANGVASNETTMSDAFAEKGNSITKLDDQLPPLQSFKPAIVSAPSAEALGANELGAPLLKLLPRGTPVKVTAQRYPWARIQIPGPVNVWVYGKYVNQQGDIARIQGKQVRARSMPSTTSASAVVGIFEENTLVKAVSKEGDWIRVSAMDVATVWALIEQLEILPQISNDWNKLWKAAHIKP